MTECLAAVERLPTMWRAARSARRRARAPGGASDPGGASGAGDPGGACEPARCGEPCDSGDPGDSAGSGDTANTGDSGQPDDSVLVWRRAPVRSGGTKRRVGGDTGPRRTSPGQGGYVTAELATAMPLVVLLLMAALFAVNAATIQIRCLDSARDAALAESRGESGAAVAAARAPEGATIQIDGTAESVTVRVTATVSPWGAWLPDLNVHGEATTAREPGHVR